MDSMDSRPLILIGIYNAYNAIPRNPRPLVEAEVDATTSEEYGRELLMGEMKKHTARVVEEVFGGGVVPQATHTSLSLQSNTWEEDGVLTYTIKVLNPPPAIDLTPGGAYILDERFTQHLERAGMGAPDAAAMRRDSRARVAAMGDDANGINALWDEKQRWLAYLATVLFEASVKARCEKRRSHPPASPLCLYATVHTAFLDRRSTLGDDGFITDAKGQRLSKELPPSIDIAAASIIYNSRRLLAFHQVMGKVAEEANEQWIKGEPFGEIIFEGGVTGLADEIGCRPRDLQAAITLGASFYVAFNGPGGWYEDNLWGASGTHPTKGRRATLTITPGMPFKPGRHGNGDHERRVPIAPLPPQYGRPNEHAAQASLHRRLVMRMVEAGWQLLSEGGAVIERLALQSMAEEIGLPISTLNRVLDHWRSGGAIEMPAKGVYFLPPNEAYGRARDFILEGARLSEGGKQRAMAAGRRKKERLLRGTKKQGK
jgi:hypothetical protein